MERAPVMPVIGGFARIGLSSNIRAEVFRREGAGARGMSARTYLVLGLALFCAAALPSSAQQIAAIGAVTAVEPDAFGTPPGVSRRTLASEMPVHASERVETAGKAWVQFRFLDSTDFRVGANSVVSLDKFVFDPERKAGELTINATRGIFRFITGTMNKEGYRIVTPNAVISVRGTELLLEVSDAGTRVMVLSGLALLSGLAALQPLLIPPNNQGSTDPAGNNGPVQLVPEDARDSAAKAVAWFDGSGALGMASGGPPGGGSGFGNMTPRPTVTPPIMPPVPPPLVPKPPPRPKY